MKFSSFLTVFLLTLSAFAQATPVTKSVLLKNKAFAELIFMALEKNVSAYSEKRAGGRTDTLLVADGFSCTKQSAFTVNGNVSEFSCALVGNQGWSFLGSEAYGSGDNENLSLSLFAALDVQVENDELFASKSITLNVNDGHGGTERNLLTCVSPTATGSSYGVRPNCQILNAL